MSTHTIKGGIPVQWGVPFGVAAGRVQTGSYTKTAQIENIPNQEGAVIGKVIYDIQITASLTITWKKSTTANLPEIGDDLKIDTAELTNALTITSVGKAYTYNGMTAVQVSAEGGVNYDPNATDDTGNEVPPPAKP